MKITLPKPITELSVAIAGYQAEADRRHEDIKRASDAFARAERLTGELEALTQRRAQLQAEAFISRKPADLSEIDAQEEKLEHASRAARADGRAAEIAIAMLNAQLEELATKIEQASEERRKLALDWLEDRRERALDRYIKALADLGPIIAEAAAADGVRGEFGDFNENRRHGAWVRQEWRKTEVPIPSTRMEQLNVCGQTRTRTPLAWRRELDHSTPERESLLALFREAGLIAPIAVAEVIDDAA